MEFLNFLSQYRMEGLNLFFQGVTYLAQEVFVVAVICWLFWCSDKRLAYTLGFSYFTSGLLVQGLKITFRIPRPWVLDPNFQAVPSAIPGATGYSFPSGHTQSITALFGTLGFHAQKRMHKYLSFFVIFLVMFSRMYLGCHTPKDVLVSFGVSITCVAVCYVLFQKKETAAGHEAMISVCMALICIGLIVYAVVLCDRQIIALDYGRDCAKAAGAGMAFALGYYIEKKYLRFTPPQTAKGKILRLITGLLAAVVLQEGLKPVLGISLPASFLRYFAVVCWILIIYPLIFLRFSRKQKN